MEKPTSKQMRKMMKRVNRLAMASNKAATQFAEMCELYYGEVSYNSADEDTVIDCLDYGQGEMDWKEFDAIMRRINSTEVEEE